MIHAIRDNLTYTRLFITAFLLTSITPLYGLHLNEFYDNYQDIKADNKQAFHDKNFLEAARSGNFTAMKQALEAGASLNACEKDSKRNILHLLMLYLREKYAEHDSATFFKRKKPTLKKDTILEWIQKGVDVNAQDINGFTPLHLLFLIDFNDISPEDAERCTQEAQHIPDDAEIAQRLDIPWEYNSAEWKLHPKADSAVLRYKMNYEDHLRATCRYSPFLDALLDGFLAAGAHVSVQNFSLADTPNKDLYNKQYSATGLKNYTYRRGGFTPVHLAVAANRPHAIKKLADHGADLDCASTCGTTALHLAAAYGYTDICKDLLDRGAHPVLKNGEDKTAQEIALQNNNTETFNLLNEATRIP